MIPAPRAFRGYALGVTRHRVVALLAVALLVAACTDATSTGTPAASAQAPTAPATPSGQSSAPVASAGPEATTPAESATPSGSTEPTPSIEPTASASTGPGAADACTGSAENRRFFAGFASAVAWPVYCAVLPAGWFVDSGKSHLAGGGWLMIGYKSPGGARLALSEGAFCTDAAGCVPAGSDTGDSAFGTQAGTLVRLDGGGFAIVAARGKTPSWLLVTHGLDEATTVQLGAALATVGG